MKIVITAQGQDVSSQVDPRFGRAEWLILVDSETGRTEAHDNTVNLNAASGAGIQTAQNIAQLGAEVVITGNIGPNAFRALAAAKIKNYLCPMTTVQEALEAYRAGKLEEVTGPNVQGHW